jgi:hypothetical protein
LNQKRCPLTIPVLAVIFCLVMVLTAGLVAAADDDKPHSHQGILPPYEPVAMNIILDKEQLQQLVDGELVQMTIEDEKSGGKGIGVIDIAAPTDTVWSRIMGFEHYREWVGPVKKCEVYHQAGDTINTHVKISSFLYKYEYFLTNVFWPEQDMLTWTLDYSRNSDFDDCVGAWTVETHPDREGWSRAWFSTDLKLKQPLPGFLMKFIRKKGIKDAISWVKEQSEIACATSR